MIQRLDQFVGNAFFEKVSTTEIKNMSYHELKYWSGWHDVFQDQYEREARRIKDGK